MVSANANLTWLAVVATSAHRALLDSVQKVARPANVTLSALLITFAIAELDSAVAGPIPTAVSATSANQATGN